MDVNGLIQTAEKGFSLQALELLLSNDVLCIHDTVFYHV